MSNYRQDFEQNGYVVLPKIVAAQEISALFTQLKAVLTYVVDHSETSIPTEHLDDMYTALKKKSPEAKGRAYDLIQHVDLAYRLSAKDQLVEFIHSLSQTPLLMDYVSIRIDDDTNDRLLPFHQEFFGQISAECYTAWIPLQDITEKTGGLRVVAGSHKQGPVKHRFYGNYHGVREDYLKNAKPQNIFLQAGDALIFHPNIFHASTPSHAQSPIRWTLITRYNALKKIPYVEKKGAPLRIEQTED